MKNYLLFLEFLLKKVKDYLNLIIMENFLGKVLEAEQLKSLEEHLAQLLMEKRLFRKVLKKQFLFWKAVLMKSMVDISTSKLVLMVLMCVQTLEFRGVS